LDLMVAAGSKDLGKASELRARENDSGLFFVFSDFSTLRDPVLRTCNSIPLVTQSQLTRD
jgi:hypothetical protein